MVKHTREDEEENKDKGVVKREPKNRIELRKNTHTKKNKIKQVVFVFYHKKRNWGKR